MFLLRLFDQSDLAQPIAAHMLRDGTTVVGRDPVSDWMIPDTECQISRHHLEFICSGGVLALRPLGANGVFRGDTGERLPDHQEVPVKLGDAIDLGKYRIVIDSVPFATRSGASFDRTTIFRPPSGEGRVVPAEWADGAATIEPYDDSSLLEAFCEGAGLEVSALSGEAPGEIMRRAGAAYRQMVLGLGDLMAERSKAKANLSMDRTTIAGQDNNPFKWAPTRRLAIDLLMGRQQGFLSAPEAIRASFEDIKGHMFGTLSGFAAAMRAVLGQLSPASIVQRIEGQSTLLKSRQAMAWAEYEKAHQSLEAEIEGQADGPMNRAFAAAYHSQADDIADGDRRAG